MATKKKGMAVAPSKKKRPTFWKVLVLIGGAVAGVAAFAQNWATIVGAVRPLLPAAPQLSASITACTRREVDVQIRNDGQKTTVLKSARISASPTGQKNEVFETRVLGAPSTEVKPKEVIPIRLQPIVGGARLVLPIYEQPCTLRITLEFTDASVGDLTCHCPTA
jgi:predicted membrane metal-binding protein